MTNKKPGFIAVLAVLFFGLIAGHTSLRGADTIRIEAPLGGYVDSGGEDISYTQDVRYPASSVNTRENQSIKAMIKGRIEGSRKGREPYTAVVNGVAMPLSVDENGRFSRPYTFGRGSNSVEILSPDRSEKKRVQFYETNTAKTRVKVRVLLSWDTDHTDLDLHVVTPDGQHCFYGNRVVPNGGALDVDVTTGYGPEIFSLPVEIRGAYHVYVNYYGGGYNQSGESEEVLTVAQVAIILNENTPDEKQQVFHIPMRKPGELTLVRSFVYP
jgi:uncharacterized protein YfaP (DUF2135 family)